MTKDLIEQITEWRHELSRSGWLAHEALQVAEFLDEVERLQTENARLRAERNEARATLVRERELQRLAPRAETALSASPVPPAAPVLPMKPSDEATKAAFAEFAGKERLAKFAGHPMLETMARSLSRAYAIDAKAPDAAQEGWQPIESAPTLKHVLIFYTNSCGAKRIVKAFRCGKFEHEECHAEDTEWLDYSEDRDAYFTPPGWYEVIDNWDDFSHVSIEWTPTKWRPLPAPPRAEGETK